MRKYVCFTAFILSFFLAASAYAADNGFYFGIKFIDSIQNTGSVSTSGLLADMADTEDYGQNTIGGGLFIGYDFYPASQIPLRAEIEYALRTDTKTDWDPKGQFSNWQIYEYAIKDYSLKSTWNLQTLFFNAYWDIRNDSDFTPYIGAGIGMGFINSKYEVEGPNVDWSKKDMQTVLAWNVGAGCSYAINENLSADLAYRFVGLGYSETEATVGGQTQKIGLAPYANEFSLGLRYTF